MSYTISYQSKALDEYKEAVRWYKKRSQLAAENFVAAVEGITEVLRNDPSRYRITYKEFHEVSLKKYPYLLIYLINEEKKEVIISSVFHNKRNPEAKFEED